jgi:hypothetical protein
LAKDAECRQNSLEGSAIKEKETIEFTLPYLSITYPGIAYHSLA